MQFLSHAVLSAYIAAPILSPILVFRMVRLSIEHGVCNISAFAFGLYGAWLVSALNSDFEGGYRMGRVAIQLMKRLGADEVGLQNKIFFMPQDLSLTFCQIFGRHFSLSLEFTQRFTPLLTFGKNRFRVSCKPHV